MGFLGFTHLSVKRKGKVLFELGEPSEPKRELTPEERQELREYSKRRWLEQREDDLDYRSGVPSSKEGRDQYLATVCWLEMPFFLIHRAWAFLMGRRYWYSKSGWCREE